MHSDLDRAPLIVVCMKQTLEMLPGLSMIGLESQVWARILGQFGYSFHALYSFHKSLCVRALVLYSCRILRGCYTSLRGFFLHALHSCRV